MLSAKSNRRPNLSQLLHITQGFGVRPTAVFVDEIIDDLPELGLQIERVERDSKPMGDASGVFGVRRRCNSPAYGPARPCTIGSNGDEPGPSPVAQAWTDSSPCRMKTPVISWPAQQQMRSHAAIDPAGHRQHHARHSTESRPDARRTIGLRTCRAATGSASCRTIGLRTCRRTRTGIGNPVVR